jgi:hypothetical protein
MNMKEYLEDRRRGFIDRGTVFMADVVDDIIEMGEVDFNEIHQVVKEFRDVYPKFSLKFMYYWSMMTFIQDFEDQRKLLKLEW